MRVRTAAIASAVWVIGAWLRLHGLSAMEFKLDELSSLDLAIQLLNDHPWSSPQPWPSHGMMSSNGIGNAPLFTWIVALLWTFAHDPVGVAALIAVINALCLIPLWFWAERRMDEHRALLTLAIASVSPFAVLFSRKIWPVDLLLPGLLAVLWSLEWLRDGRGWRAIALGGAGVLLITQLHQSGWITAPLLLLALAIQWRIDWRRGGVTRFTRPSIGEMVAIAVVVVAHLFSWWTYVPYLMTVPAEVYTARVRAPWFEPQLLLNVISEVVPRHVLDPFVVELVAFRADSIRATVYDASLVLGAPLAAYGIWRWLRAPFTIPVAGVWWWLIMLAFMLGRILSYHYYVLATSPLPIVLAAGAFDGTLTPRWERILRGWRWTYAGALLALTIITGAWLTGRGGSSGDYGVTFEVQAAQAQTLIARARGEHQAPNRFRGEVAGTADSLSCHPVSTEVTWLAGWIEQTTTPDLSRFVICDGWMENGEGVRYRWVARDMPPP